MRPIRIQIKTQVLLIMAFVVLIVLSTGLIYISLSNYSHNDFFRLLKLRANTAAQVQLDGLQYNDGFNESGRQRDYFERLPDEKDYFIKLQPDYDFSSDADRIQVPISFFDELIAHGEARHYNSHTFYAGVIYESDAGPFAVVVKADNYYDTHHFAFLQRMLIANVCIAFVLALLISAFLSKTIFKPLQLITHKVNQISLESLHLRLDNVYNKDELSAMIDTFNNMLDRIETSFETQNNFISNASHEFRTPLTAIIGGGEVALSKKRSPEEYEETIRIILQEAEKLDRKTQALLFLAQTGFRGKSLMGEIVRVDQVLWDVKETLQNINSESIITFDLSKLPENSSQLKIHGNEQLLHLAFSNIINNACKYSDQRSVNVSLEAAQGKIEVHVKDTGIGIPKDELRHIYDPFFRASNTMPYEGFGIGMPLSRNIIRMHNGEINVISEQNIGTTVVITLPMAEVDA